MLIRCINVVQCCVNVYNVVSTLFQRPALRLYQRCATLKIRRRILFHFQRQINVISTSTTLKHRSSDVEMSAGLTTVLEKNDPKKQKFILANNT